MNCRFCGKEIDEKNLYGKGLFCNRSCQARFNCKQNSENRKGTKLKPRFEKTCKACGKVFEVTEATSNRQFCSKYCSSHYGENKKHTRTETSRRKTALTLEQTLSTRKKFNFELNGKVIYTDRTVYSCKICGKQRLAPFKTGFCRDCLNNTEEGKAFWKENCKHAAKRAVIEGKNKPWKPRNQKSYPELFWQKVLEKNSILFKQEVSVPVEDTCYFLDFEITKNGKLIDLEIDGGQHKLPEWILHDTKRNESLTKKGYLVYRVGWNEISTETGRNSMEVKVKDFLKFYESI